MNEVGELEVARRDGLEMVYRRVVGRAEALARALTGDPHLAQDIAHDAFIRVAGRFGHLRDPGAFDAYLRRAVINGCRSHFRRLREERTGLRRIGVTPEAVEAGGPEERDALWTAIQALPFRQRAAVVLRYYEDLSEAQAGDVLRCSPRAVNSLISRAMATLRTEMEER